MTVEPNGDHIVLIPNSADEVRLLGVIVRAIATGGVIYSKSELGEFELEFDGDPSETKRKKKRKKIKAK